MGSFFHKGLGISKEDLARINGQRDGGKVALGLVVKTEEVDALTVKLKELGGQARSLRSDR